MTSRNPYAAALDKLCDAANAWAEIKYGAIGDAAKRLDDLKAAAHEFVGADNFPPGSETHNSGEPRFFQLLVHDDFTGERPGWYWQDDDCEEPMGPFSSRREAVEDFHECRPGAQR